MARITKGETKARNEAWRLAVDEGRVVRYGEPSWPNVSFTAFTTVAEAQASVVDADSEHVRIVVRPKESLKCSTK